MEERGSDSVSRRLKWMWALLPAHSLLGLAIKVASGFFAAASSLTPALKREAWSAAERLSGVSQV